MEKKGIILIVDDRIDEKIGTFEGHLYKNGFSVKIAGTLEEADRDLDNYLSDNTLDGIILDFSFPVDSKDQSVNTKGIPNGVVLLDKYKFKIGVKRIPVVINTTGDEDYKKKYLGSLKNLEMPIYNVNHQANPLARPSTRMVRDIVNMFNQRYEYRKTTGRIQQDRSWLNKGTTGTYDQKTGKYHYNRNGD